MSKTFKFIKYEGAYLVILKYFEGDPALLSKTTVKDLENGTFNGELIPAIDPTIIKNLKSFISAQKKYQVNFVYPEWSPDIVKEKMDKMFLKDSKDSKDLGDWADMASDEHIDISDEKEKSKVKSVSEPDEIRYSADHHQWSDSIIFNSNNNFRRSVKKTEFGKWSIKDDILTLNWDKWDPEVLTTEDNGITYRTEGNFIITLKSVKEPPSWFNGRTKKEKELEKLRRIIAANSNTAAELKKEETKDRISNITQQLSTTLVLRSRT